MAIKSLTLQEFNAYQVFRGPLVGMLWEERAWFCTPNDRILGVISWDRVDHDWNFVVLQAWENQRVYSRREVAEKGLRPGQYTAVDMQVSLPSYEVAEAKLFAAMSNAGVTEYGPELLSSNT
jgi:hypothetical protein